LEASAKEPSAKGMSIPKDQELSNTLGRLLEDKNIGRLLSPRPVECSFADLGRLLAPGRFAILSKRLAFLREKLPPIIGVCGTMNSGKSTLVRSFLSHAGAKRVLVGDQQAEGTHRFVFWLPARWKADPETHRHLQEFIHSAFDREAEELSSDEGEAASQYNARASRLGELRLPLIAFDPMLDAANLAFLDCPDIQRSADETRGEKTAQIRREALQLASRLCSAFVIVSTPQQYGSETVGEIFATLSQAGGKVPAYFAVNMIPAGKDSRAYLNDVQRVIQRWNAKVSRVFGAFNVQGENPLPHFCDLANAGFTLSDLPGELAASQLEITFRRSAASDASAQFAAIAQTAQERQLEQKGAAANAREDMLHFIAGKFMSEKGDLRPLLSAAVAEALKESMERTAPMWIRPMLTLHSPVKWVKKAASLVAEKSGGILRGAFSPALPAKDTHVDTAAANLASLGRDDFAHEMLGRRWLPISATQDDLTQVWIRSVQALDHVEKLDTEKLDARTREAWTEMGAGAKMKLAGVIAASVAGGLAVALAAPIDFGSSAVIYAASVKELLAVAGLGYLLNSGAVGSLSQELERQVALPQLANLYAGLQDGLGVPRDFTATMKRKGSSQHIKLDNPQTEPQPTRVQALPPPVVELDLPRLEEMRKRFMELLSNLQEAGA